MKEIRLKIPTEYVKLSQKQLVFISRLLLMGYSESEFLVKAFLFLSGLKLLVKEPAADGARWYKVKRQRKPFLLTTDQLATMTEKCRFLLEPGEIKPINWIKFCRARNYRLYNARFEEYLMAENYYFAYIETRKDEHLDNLISVLYRRPWHFWNAGKIRKRAKRFRDVDAAVKNSVFMWYIGFRAMVPKRCPNLFSGKKSTGKLNISEYINGMIHQLNNSDITSNKRLLKQPVWYALNELEMRALDAARVEESMKRPS